MAAGNESGAEDAADVARAEDTDFGRGHGNGPSGRRIGVSSSVGCTEAVLGRKEEAMAGSGPQVAIGRALVALVTCLILTACEPAKEPQGKSTSTPTATPTPAPTPTSTPHSTL